MYYSCNISTIYCNICTVYSYIVISLSPLTILGSLHRGILNAYGRVDRGKLIALDRGIDKNSCFGSAVGDTFDHFKRIQNLLKESGIVNNSKNISKILINGKNDLKVNNNNNNDNDNNKNVGKNSDDEGNNNVGDIRSGRGGNSSSSSSNNNSDKKKSASSSVDDNSVPVIDTLLSNLLINSVLSALKAGDAWGKYSLPDISLLHISFPSLLPSFSTSSFFIPIK